MNDLESAADACHAMSQLHFKRLLKESAGSKISRMAVLRLRTAQSAPATGLHCQPVDDNMLDTWHQGSRFAVDVEEWKVDMDFPADSALQKSLKNLAAAWQAECLEGLP